MNWERLWTIGDFRRLEIETALDPLIPVIPVLFAGAKVPSKSQLPPTMEDLASRSGLEVRRDPDFHRDMDTLIRGLDDILSKDDVPDQSGRFPRNCL